MLKDMSRAVIAGLTLVGLGFIAILLGYNGAARVNCVDCQLPYLLSGGVLGLGLIFLGSGLLVFEALRRNHLHLERKLDAVVEALQGKTTTTEATAPVPVVKPATAKTVTRASANGAVAVGKTSFHRPDCRLVAGKDEITLASLDEAQAQGLEPCRVCEPTRVTARRGR